MKAGYVEIFLCMIALLILGLAAHRPSARKIHANQISLIAISIALFGLAATLFANSQPSHTSPPSPNTAPKTSVVAQSTSQHHTDADTSLLRSELQTRQQQLNILDGQIAKITKNISGAKSLLDDDEKNLNQLRKDNSVGDGAVAKENMGEKSALEAHYQSDKQLYDQLTSQLNLAILYKLKIRNRINQINNLTSN